MSATEPIPAEGQQGGSGEVRPDSSEGLSQEVQPFTTEDTTPSEGVTDPSSPSYDFLAHMRSDPEKALQILRDTQADRDRTKGEIEAIRKSLGPLRQYVEAGQGEAIQAYLNHYFTLRNHPSLQPHIVSLEQGQPLPAHLAAGSSDNGEPVYEEPWEKALREKDADIAALRRQVSELRSDSGLSKLETHAKRFFSEWSDLTDEDRQAINSGIKADFDNYAQTEQGQNVLRNMQYETVRALALKHLGDDAIQRAHARKFQREQQARAQRSTDSPSGVTTGREAPSMDGASTLDVWLRSQEEVSRRQF